MGGQEVFSKEVEQASRNKHPGHQHLALEVTVQTPSDCCPLTLTSSDQSALQPAGHFPS